MGVVDEIEKEFRKHQKENKALVESGNSFFNPILTVRKAHEEVGLHSQMIYGLINPESDHYQGGLLLKEFISTINVDINNIDDELSCAKVFRERELSPGLGRIDLIIELKNYWIIVENKIYAIDQRCQIDRYIKSVENYEDDEKFSAKKKIVVYLTPRRKMPSKNSLSEWNSVAYDKNSYCTLYLCSYSEIFEWCRKCLQLCQIKNNLRLKISLEFYADVVSRLIYKKKFLGGETFSEKIVTNEDFFINSLSDDQRQCLFDLFRSDRLIDCLWLKDNLIPSAPSKNPSKLIESSLNELLNMFIEKIVLMAIEDGYQYATIDNGLLGSSNKKYLFNRCNWFSSFYGKKDTRNNQLVAFTSCGSLWFVIFFAKSAVYQGFVGLSEGKFEKPESDAKIVADGYAPYSGKNNPLSARLLCKPVLNVRHYLSKGKKFDEKFKLNDVISQLSRPDDFYGQVMRRAMQQHLPKNISDESSVSLCSRFSLEKSSLAT